MRLYRPEAGERGPVAALRWGTAGLLIAGLHLGAGWWLASRSFAAPPDVAKGIPIDLEPVALPDNAPTPNSAAASGPAPVVQAAASPDPTPPAETPTPPPVEPKPAVEPPPPASEPPQAVAKAAPTPPEPMPPEPAPPEDVQPLPPPVQPPSEPPPVPPPPPQATTSGAVLAAPPPVPRPKVSPKPDPRVLVREAVRRKAMAEKRERERAVRQEAQAAARAEQPRAGGGPGAVPAAPSSASSGADVATWRGAVVAHLSGFKPAANGVAGMVRVTFAVDRGGRVTSASLAGSSGDAQLDAAAVDMVRRASPVPPPPAAMGARISLTVPVMFH